MNELQRRPEETGSDWLKRLLRIDPRALPRRPRLAWELSVGYARYLATREAVSPCRVVPA